MDPFSMLRPCFMNFDVSSSSVYEFSMLRPCDENLPSKASVSDFIVKRIFDGSIGK